MKGDKFYDPLAYLTFRQIKLCKEIDELKAELKVNHADTANLKNMIAYKEKQLERADWLLY